VYTTDIVQRLQQLLDGSGVQELRHGIERLSNAGPDDHCQVIIRGDRVKSQGQTFKPAVAGINLGDMQAFAHGQLYVACSRVGNPRNLYLCRQVFALLS